jgi:hypothetical protein
VPLDSDFDLLRVGDPSIAVEYGLEDAIPSNIYFRQKGTVMRNSQLVVTLLSVALLGAENTAYRVTHTYTLGGDGSWDYIVADPPNHRLFIARQNRVMVVDENSGHLLGEITGIKGAHGTAVASGTDPGFATSGNDQSVVMFDLKTLEVLGRIPAAKDADAVIYDSAAMRTRRP